MNISKEFSLEHFCFDLDGTLIDSNKTIYETTIQTFKELGKGCDISEKDFVSHIGKHFVDIFKHFDVNVTDFDEFIQRYKQIYFDFIEYSVVYPGVVNTLSELNKQKVKISLLTTKAQDQADLIIDHFDLRKYFDFVMGRRDNFAHKPSPEPLIFICKEIKVDIDETLMVGDTELDIQCGKNAGAKTCGVLYGYRSLKLIEDEKPDLIIKSFDELLSLTGK